MKEIDRRTEYQIDEAEKSALAQGIFDEARIAQITGRIRALGEMEKAALGRSSANEIEVTAIKGAAAQRNTVIEYYRDIFSSLKQQAGGVFDALLTKSQSVWSAIGNSLKTAILTAIKDVVTSRVAAMLTQLFIPDANVQFRQGGLGQGGPLGRLGAVLGIGAVPVFGGATGAAGSLPNILAPVLGPGATPPFVPATSGPGAGIGAATATSSGIFSKAGWAGILPGLKSLFGITPSIQIADGIATTWQAATMAQKLSSVGHSTGAALAGGMLALDGLRRGGYTGLAETTAGGAIIGYKFGGPIGAAIGAAAGAVAGIVRLFVKGALEKAKEKIKALYGVDISDKGILHQIVDMAKSGFGGNLDMAIRSPQIRDLIQLYAMSTGQKTTGMPGSVTPLSLVETGGSLFQSPQFQNGAPLSALGGFPSLDRIGRGTPSGGGLVIQLDGPATTALLRGEAVQAIADNPRAVQSASMSATKSNANRRELTSLQLSPGLLTS
ncbi:MAG: hypothetical protein HYZ37_11995 [Candidatus Solibacter usitatus]|nr:hypothetical protein [Candidatus Solibacter usitatus]